MQRLPKLSELVREALWALLVRIMGVGSVFFMNLAIARAVGAKEAGYYFLALAIITFLSSICRLGFDNAVLRFVGSNANACRWGMVDSVFRQTVTATFAVSSLATTLLWVFSPQISEIVFGKPQLAATLRAISPGLIGLSLCVLLSYMLQGIRRITGSVFVQSLGIALGVIAVSPFLPDAKIGAFAYSVTSFVVAGLGYFWWKRAHPAEPGTFSSRILWGSALPLWVVACTMALQQWSGQFVAGAYVPPEDLAKLAVAQRTSVLINFLLVAVNLVVAPRLAAFFDQGRVEDVRKIAQASVRLILGIAGPFLFILLFWAEWIMGLFGPGFSHGASFLRVLAVGQFVNVATGSVSYILMMGGYERDMRNIALYIGPLAVVLALLLTPRFGALGAATATAIAVASQNLLAAYFVKKRLGFFTMAIWRR